MIFKVNMYIHNEKILDFMQNKNFLYIIQCASKIPEIYNCLKSRDFILLSFKENTSDTTIFYPKSTWTNGRNKLREHIFNMKQKYDYYIFLDEDVVFSGYSQEDGFNNFEKLLLKYKPFIGNPNFGGYYNKTTYLNKLPLGEAQTTIWFDGLCNAFSNEAFFSNIIFPYINYFDNKSWWMSQYIMIILCSIYKKEVVLFNNLIVTNEIHSEYPKLDVFKETEQYVLNNIIDINKLNIINNIKSTSIFKILEFLNIIFKKFNKINFIDVGCAIGDVRQILDHSNIFSIGIDPLIEKYKKRKNNLNKYNILYNVAIDVKACETFFNITESLDTSSLYDFNTEITSIENNNGKFYIPNDIINYITKITETITIKTQTLKNIIEENNLKETIIHILKIDAQGNDLNVIKSIGKYLNNVMFIIMESTSDNTTTLYKDSSHFSEDYNYLKKNNFELITTEVLLKDDLDCLYYNKNLIKNFDLNWDKKVFYEKTIGENKPLVRRQTNVDFWLWRVSLFKNSVFPPKNKFLRIFRWKKRLN